MPRAGIARGHRGSTWLYKCLGLIGSPTNRHAALDLDSRNQSLNCFGRQPLHLYHLVTVLARGGLVCRGRGPSDRI